MVTTIRGLVREQGGNIPGCQTQNFARKVQEQKLTTEISGLIAPLVKLVETIDAQLRLGFRPFHEAGGGTRRSQHFLNFCPLPQGHGSLRPTFDASALG